MYKVHEIDKSEGWYFIKDSATGAIIHEGTFDNRDEAQAFANAYNSGASTFEEACAMVYGLPDDDAL
jgi:hypothetical protein